MAAISEEEVITTPKASMQITESMPKLKSSREAHRSREAKVEDKENISEQERLRMLQRKQSSLERPKPQKSREEVMQSLMGAQKSVLPVAKKTISEDKILGDVTNTIAHSESVLDNSAMRAMRSSQRRISDMQGPKTNLDDMGVGTRRLQEQQV